MATVRKLWASRLVHTAQGGLLLHLALHTDSSYTVAVGADGYFSMVSFTSTDEAYKNEIMYKDSNLPTETITGVRMACELFG